VSDPQGLRCATCGADMTRVDRAPHPGAAIELDFYQCSVLTCGRKVALWWELTGKPLTADEMSWVEREVRRRGAFFPADYR
jgi:hypothetical protein